MSDEGHSHPQKDHRGGHEVEREPSFSNGRKEAGAHLESDGVDEQNEPEFADEFQNMFVDGHPKMAKQKSCKEDTRNADVDAENFKVAQR